MKIQVERMSDEGVAFVETFDIDVRVDTLTMREAVLVESILGEEKFERMVDGELRSPAVVQAVLYAKLKSIIPDLELDAFDVDLEDFVGSQEPVGKE